MEPHRHLATPHDPSLGAYEAVRRFCDPDSTDQERSNALAELMTLRCDHGDEVVRRVVTAGVHDAITTALWDVAAYEYEPGPGSFTDVPSGDYAAPYCHWCGELYEDHGEWCQLALPF